MKSVLNHLILKTASFTLPLLVLSGCGGDGSTPESASRMFVQSAYSGDTKTMFALLGYDRATPKNDEQIKDLKNMKGKLSSMSAEMLRDTRARGGIKEVKATERKCDENMEECEMTVVVSYNKDPKTDTEHVKVVKRSGSWMPVLL